MSESFKPKSLEDMRVSNELLRAIWQSESAARAPDPIRLVVLESDSKRAREVGILLRSMAGGTRVSVNVFDVAAMGSKTIMSCSNLHEAFVSPEEQLREKALSKPPGLPQRFQRDWRKVKPARR